MTDLEQSYGETLFDRQARGYGLTAAGAELLEQAVEVEERVLNIERRRDNRRATLPVHISAGTWTTYFLTSHIAALQSDDTRLVLHASELPHNISRRETTIGIRNARPQEPALVARKTGRVAFAAYSAPHVADSGKWLSSSVQTPSANWVRSHQGRQIVMEVSSPRSLLDLAKQGVGQAVLPCFIGDRETGLVRCGDVIDELTGDQWLVVHGEDRNQPQVRRTINAIAKLLTTHAGLFAGQQ
jgi:DNA-binding transcriptional LysR family regulator